MHPKTTNLHFNRLFEKATPGQVAIYALLLADRRAAHNRAGVVLNPTEDAQTKMELLEIAIRDDENEIAEMRSQRKFVSSLIDTCATGLAVVFGHASGIMPRNRV